MEAAVFVPEVMYASGQLTEIPSGERHLFVIQLEDHTARWLLVDSNIELGMACCWQGMMSGINYYSRIYSYGTCEVCYQYIDMPYYL